MTQTAEKHLAEFERLSGELSTLGSRRIQELRAAAAARFSELGFPTIREEEWRYTNVAPIANGDFPAAPPRPGVLSRKDADAIALPGSAARLVFLDGHYRQDLSRVEALPEGAVVQSLAAALSSGSEGVERFLSRIAPFSQSPFVALNTAYLRDGAWIFLPRGCGAETFVELLFLASPGAKTSSFPRVLVVAGEDASAKIVEHYAALDGGAYLTNAVTEISAGKNSAVEHIKIQRESDAAYHVATLRAAVAGGASFRTHNLCFGGLLARNDVEASLDGEHVSCTLNGLYLLSDAQHCDNHTGIEHRKPEGESRELYKGILADRSTGIFRGKIHVFPDAQKTDAKQSNANLLLSRDATVDTKPQLEIYADDVKCTHGATVGQLDEDALFYMRARGLPFESARNLLLHAFAADVTERVPVAAVRERAQAWVADRLLGGMPR